METKPKTKVIEKPKETTFFERPRYNTLLGYREGKTTPSKGKFDKIVIGKL